jgi:hypothetical protein
MKREESSRRLTVKRQPSDCAVERSATSSTHAKETTTNSVDPRRTTRRASLDHATSYHGSTMTASSMSTGVLTRTITKSRTRGTPARHKSSDNMEFTGGRRDDLGAATLHGKSSVSRIRSSRRLSSGSGSVERVSRRSGGEGDGRRSNMKRAMSRENVIRPEEYGPGGVMHGGAGQAKPTPDVREPRRGRRRPVKEEPKQIEEEEDADDDDDDDDSFADDIELEPAPARRDVLGLLRDQKPFKVSDFHEKDNRRILHFLLYQHKLGIDLAGLQAMVDHDIATKGAEEALRRPFPPLFVEPA